MRLSDTEASRLVCRRRRGQGGCAAGLAAILTAGIVLLTSVYLDGVNDDLEVGAMPIYPKIFADYQQSSFQSQTTRIRGDQLWVAKSTDPNASFPELIILSEKGLTVQYGSYFEHLDYGGTRLWNVSHDGGLNILISGSQIFYRSGACLYAVDFDMRETLHAFHVTSSTARGFFYMVLPKGAGRFLVQTFNRAPEVDLDMPPGKNEYALVMMGPNRREWIQQFEGRPLVALVTRDQGKVVLLKESEKVAIFDCEKGRLAESFELPRVAFLNASLDRKDNLVVVQKDGEGNFDLVNCTLKGGRIWGYRLPRSREGHSWQPPGIDDQNRVYYIHNGVLHAVENGDLAWELGIPQGRGPQYLTVLGDRTLLVSSKNILFHLDQNGAVLLSRLWPDDEEIWTPPVVDDKGRVYVGTNKGIYCLQ